MMHLDINPPYNTSANTISAVAVDPVRGQLYWSDKVITYGLTRMDMRHTVACRFGRAEPYSSDSLWL